jgi:hypothetical protein
MSTYSQLQEALTILAILVMIIWYLSRYAILSKSNRAIITSPDIYYNRAKQGLTHTGVWIILSLIPYIGFIFMWASASSSRKIGQVGGHLHRTLAGAPRMYSIIGFLTGLGMIFEIPFIGLNPNFNGGFTPGNFANSELVYIIHLWYPIYIAAAILALVTISSRGIGGAALFLGIIFQIVQFSIGNYVDLLAIPFIIGIMYIFSGSATKSARIDFIKAGGKVSGKTQTIVTEKPKPAQPEPTPTPQTNVGDIDMESNMKQKTNVDRRIDPRELIAMVGPPASGKTTFLAYFFHFLPDIETKTNLTIEVNPGIELMEEYLRRIISEHKFPELTAMDKIGEVVFNFTRKKRFGANSTYLRVNDIAGERFNTLQGGKENVRSQLMNTRFEYLLRSRAYLIMIDCSTYREWATKDLEYMRILHSIITARIERNTPRIAFIFTKTDTLPSAVINYSPIQLLEILKNTNAYVKKYIKNPSAFKIYIKTERDNDGTIVPKLDVDVGGRLDIKFDPEFNEGFLYVAQWIAEVGGI